MVRATVFGEPQPQRLSPRIGCSVAACADWRLVAETNTSGASLGVLRRGEMVGGLRPYGGVELSAGVARQMRRWTYAGTDAMPWDRTTNRPLSPASDPPPAQRTVVRGALVLGADVWLTRRLGLFAEVDVAPTLVARGTPSRTWVPPDFQVSAPASGLRLAW